MHAVTVEGFKSAEPFISATDSTTCFLSLCAASYMLSLSLCADAE